MDLDLDLLSEYMEDDQHDSARQLLSNLPDRKLTSGSDENIPNVPDDIQARGKNQQTSLPARNNANQAGAVISKIEKVFESITDCILDEKKELVIRLKTRSKAKAIAEDGMNEGSSKMKKSQFRRITFPSKNPKEAWRFTALLRILELSHEALVTGIITTKRDVYYRDPELFLKQGVVDRYVDDIAYTFGVNRDALNIVAAAKGLVAGSFSVTRKDGSTIDFAAEDGLLIPNPNEVIHTDLIDIRWMLVIEKEATFRTLATNKYWKDSSAGQGIIITAKGYPDIQTRHFLSLLSHSHPHIPIYALVDYDPDGIGILSTYKYSSVSLAHETDLSVPSIHWLGVRSGDFVPGAGNASGGDELLPMSARDRRIARKMLERETFGGEDGEGEMEWRREMQVMLMLGVKAEIQILGNGEALGEWLDGKIGFAGREMVEDIDMMDI